MEENEIKEELIEIKQGLKNLTKGFFRLIAILQKEVDDGDDVMDPQCIVKEPEKPEIKPLHTPKSFSAEQSEDKEDNSDDWEEVPFYV